MKGSFPVLSFVKGLAFTLVDLTDTPSLLRSLKIGDAPEPELDEGWRGSPSFCGCMYYVQLDPDSRGYPYINHLRVRMIACRHGRPSFGVRVLHPSMLSGTP